MPSPTSTPTAADLDRLADLAVLDRGDVEAQRPWLELFERVDLVLLPTTAMVARRADAIHGKPGERLEADRLCCWASLCGLPALSLPMGRGDDGLPCGLQVVAAPWQEGWLAAAAIRLVDAGLGR